MKLLWSFILLLVVFLHLSVIYGQCVFHKLYDYNELNNVGLAIIQTSDGDFICSSSTYDGRSHILRLDECGDTVWTKIFDYSHIGADDGYSVIQSTDGNFIICGVMTDTINIEGDTFILKIDANGNPIWYKTIEGGYGDKGVMIKQTSDEGYILGGVNYDSISYISQVFLLKTDISGDKEWQKEYGDIGYDFIESIDFTPDGGYILGGEFENPITSSWDMFIIKTDSQGNEQWKEYYGTSYTERKGYAITTQDSGYAIVGYTENAAGDYNAYIVKTDSLGGIEWQKDFGYSTEHDLFKFIRQLQNGDFIVAGGISDTSYNPAPPWVWLMKISQQGDSLWSKFYSYYGLSIQYAMNTDTYVEDLQLSSDGGFVMTGYIINNALPAKNDLWLLKTDSLGNICEIDTITWEGCSEYVSVVELNGNNKAGNIIIYPNPAEEYITIESYDQAIRKVEISDIHGRIERSVCNINTGIENINLSELRAGLYFVRVHCDQFVKTLKIVKQ
ncbi:MAG: T9SS type A sorting domain-containing protein [Bacteroidota bacterium]